MRHNRKDYESIQPDASDEAWDLISRTALYLRGVEGDPRARELAGRVHTFLGKVHRPRIPADEPVFLLRSTDVTAPHTVRFWADCNRSTDPQMAASLDLWADEMARYAATYYGGGRTPDVDRVLLRMRPWDPEWRRPAEARSAEVVGSPSSGEHEVEAGFLPKLGIYQADCSCGWKSFAYSRLIMAEQAAAHHARTAPPGPHRDNPTCWHSEIPEECPHCAAALAAHGVPPGPCPACGGERRWEKTGNWIAAICLQCGRRSADRPEPVSTQSAVQSSDSSPSDEAEKSEPITVKSEDDPTCWHSEDPDTCPHCRAVIEGHVYRPDPWAELEHLTNAFSGRLLRLGDPDPESFGSIRRARRVLKERPARSVPITPIQALTQTCFICREPVKLPNVHWAWGNDVAHRGCVMDPESDTGGH